MKDKETEYVLLHIACTQFAARMESKLVNKLLQGRSGWNDPDWPIESIKQQMIEHIEKGDFVDVANFAMFAWHQQLEHVRESDKLDEYEEHLK